MSIASYISVKHQKVFAILIVTFVAGVMLLLQKPVPPELAPLAWLIPLAIYDLQKREVPHIAFVAVPCFLAAFAAILRGDASLGVLTLVLIALSERNHLPKPMARVVLVSALLSSVGLLLITPFEQSPGALALMGFWFAYELGWWAGVDALAAMTLAILWPDVMLLVALGVAHLGLAFLLPHGKLFTRPRRLTEAELEQVGVAGLPSIALGAALYVLWQWWIA